MNKTQLFFKKHSSTILTVIGAVGVVGTAVLSVKATPKALKLIEEKKQELEKEELTAIETVKAAWKPYIPAAITGFSTIACIFGANYLSVRSQASLMSAYALLDRSYKEYREKTKELYPEESTNVQHEMLKSRFDKDMELDENKELFFDFESMRYFNSTMEEVETAADLLNKKFSMDGHACLNDFYDFLGLPHTPYGYQLGWSLMNNDKMYGKPELEFDFDKIELDDGLECTTVTINYPPSIEYTC